MSDEYWTEDELNEMYNQEFDPEKIFHLANINLDKGTIQHIHLQDEEGDEVVLSDIVQQLIKYIDKQSMDENDNQFKDQIIPLITQAAVSTISRSVPFELASILLGTSVLRGALLRSMALSFLLVKFIQKNNIKITTTEEKISQEEVEEMTRRSVEAENKMLKLSDRPIDIRSTLRTLYQDGHITKEDLQDIIGDNDDDN